MTPHQGAFLLQLHQALCIEPLAIVAVLASSAPLGQLPTDPGHGAVAALHRVIHRCIPAARKHSSIFCQLLLTAGLGSCTNQPCGLGDASLDSCNLCTV